MTPFTHRHGTYHVWRDFDKQGFIYDAAGNVTRMTDLYWDKTSVKWINSTRTTNTYLAYGKITQQLIEMWDTGSKAWVNEYNIINTYNANQYMTSSLMQDWDTGTSAWTNSSMTAYTNNSDGTINYNILQYWESSAWTNAYTNTPQITHNDNSLVLFPNPTTENVSIYFKEIPKPKAFISVYGINGNCIIHHFPISGDYTLDMSKFKKGAYYINVIYENKISLYEVVKN